MCERAVWVNFPAKLISAHSPTCSRLSAGGWVAQWALVQVGGAAAEKTPEVGNWVTKCISCVRRNISAYGGRLTEPQQCRRNEKRKTETREQEPKARHGHGPWFPGKTKIALHTRISHMTYAEYQHTRTWNWLLYGFLSPLGRHCIFKLQQLACKPLTPLQP